MKRTEFATLVRKLKLLNPFAGIGISSKSTEVIWSETPAEELVLPPTFELKDGRITMDNWKHSIEVRAYS